MSRHSVSEGAPISLDTVAGSTVSSVVQGSTASDGMPANRVAESPGDFSAWANDALLVPPSNEAPLTLPPTLEELLAASKVVPRWIFDSRSSQYSYPRSMFGAQISTFSAAAAPTFFTILDDPGESENHEYALLSKDVEYSLVPVFQVIEHMACLKQHPSTSPNEADRRSAVDNLTSHLWNYPAHKDLIHTLERVVQLPNSTKTGVAEARPHSTVFFRLENTTLVAVPVQVAQACSCLQPRLDSTQEYVLHWVTEYEGKGHSDASKRQAWMVMASGLYQRRSLGFKDHFVFGAAHHSHFLLTVFAGKWVDYADLPMAARTTLLTEKIIIYTLGTFSMNDPIQMLQYYLLMRSTRRLALQYKLSIDNQAGMLARNAGPDVHSWPPAAQPKSSAGRKKRKRTGSEAKGAPGGNAPPMNVASLDTEDYIQQPVHVMGVDDPLVHRFAEELSENGESAKVRGYLMSSIHDDYDYRVDTS